MIFIFQSVNVYFQSVNVYHDDSFVDIDPSLPPGCKSHLIMVYDSFNVLFNLVY